MKAEKKNYNKFYRMFVRRNSKGSDYMKRKKNVNRKRKSQSC